MTFADDMQSDLATFINSDEFGTAVAYAPVLDDPVIEDSVSCKVLIDRDVVIQPSDYDAQVVEVGTTIEALYSDVGTPQKGSTFTSADTVFTVQRVQDNDKVFVKMVVTEAEVW